jgi:hypothetical protein
MLTSEDCEVLGINTRIRNGAPSSAVSQALRALSAEPEGLLTWDLPDRVDGQPGFRVRVAADRETRERAYRLAYRVYRAKDYVPPDERGLIVSACDARPQTLTVLVEDASGREAGTISLVFDSAAGMPCDEIYGPEVGELRSHGRRLVEVTRLAIDEGYARSKALLTLLCNVPFAYGMRVGGCTDLVIEVNPRHVAYYVRLMKFEVLGPERACPRVLGAPAMLLRADLGMYEADMLRLGGLGSACTERSLFPHFFAGAREWEFARFLACNHHPMTIDDVRHFGLERSTPFQHGAWSAAGN